MFDFLRSYQLDIMFGLVGICLVVALFTSVTKTIPNHRRPVLLALEFCTAIWLGADRVAYIYHGAPGAYWEVKISNFLVFLMTIAVLFFINRFMENVMVNDGGLKSVPRILRFADLLAVIAMLLVVISQFTGLYYTIDHTNTYQRSELYFLSYIFPYVILLIQAGVLIGARKDIWGRTGFSLFLFDAVCLLSSMIQFFAYGVSLLDMSAGFMVIVVYFFSLLDMNQRAEQANQAHISGLTEGYEKIWRLFGNLAGILSDYLDTLFVYSGGHAARVASYAEKIAQELGRSKEYQEQVYYAALLHDIDKIVADDTGNPDTRVDRIAALANRLINISRDYPIISQGIRFHRERYDGKGVPEGLKGNSIPEVARIIALAENYDLLTSKNSVRECLPQATVRDELVREAGSAFDPDVVKVMVELIDRDVDYLMRPEEEADSDREVSDLSRVGPAHHMHFRRYKELVTDGIPITGEVIRIGLQVATDKGVDSRVAQPALIIFDSYDGCVHTDDVSIRSLHYVEFGEIWADGHGIQSAARNMECSSSAVDGAADMAAEAEAPDTEKSSYEIEAVRYGDHVKVTIGDGNRLVEGVLALPDAVGHVYLGISGEHCSFTEAKIQKTGQIIDENYIRRIAPETSYINRLAGDIPNVQVDENRTAYSQPLVASDGLRVVFRAESLPTANLIWHCPYILLFTSRDGQVHGEGYGELSCIRLDGEAVSVDPLVSCDILTQKTGEFDGWDVWKDTYRKGFASEIRLGRKRRSISLETENAGIKLRCTIPVPNDVKDVYLALTGCRCALTNIRVF